MPTALKVPLEFRATASTLHSAGAKRGLPLHPPGRGSGAQDGGVHWRNQLRERDLPARWAGDEVVVLFHDASKAVAQTVCERIQSAVADCDWDSIARGLRLSVTIGISAARAGDDAESVLHRSDQSMYLTKR